MITLACLPRDLTSYLCGKVARISLAQLGRQLRPARFDRDLRGLLLLVCRSQRSVKFLLNHNDLTSNLLSYARTLVSTASAERKCPVRR